MINIDNIDKKADLFGMEDDDGSAVMNVDKREGFKAGAEWMRDELKRWHDPKEELPEVGKDLLLKMQHSDQTVNYAAGWLSERMRFVVSQLFCTGRLVAWRYIRE